MNKRLIIYLLVSLLLIVFLFPHVRPIPEEPVSYLTYLIYLLGAVGMGVFYFHIFRVDKEQKCSAEAQQQAANFLWEIRNGHSAFNLENLDKIGSTEYRLSTNRMIDHIKTEARSRRFDSSLTILNAYKDEFMSSFVRIAGFQKIALQLGILGTFIGLSMAFRKIDTNNVDFGALITALKLPFATSIAGLEVSLILWLHLDYLHQKQEALFIGLEKCIDEVLNLARQAVFKGSILVELDHIGLKIDDMNARIEKESAQIEKQTGQIAEGLQHLGKAGAGLDDFLGQIVDKQLQFMRSVEELYKSLSPQQITSELKLGLTDTVSAMTKGLSQLEEYIEQQRKKQEADTVHQQQALFSRMDLLLKAQQEYTQQLKNVDMKEHIRQVIANAALQVSNDLNAQVQKLLHPMSRLSDTIDTQNELMLRKLNKKSFIHRMFSKN